MKNETTTAGTTPAETTALLLPLDVEGFTAILEQVTTESPEDFAANMTVRRIESAHRRAWCEVMEASEKFQPITGTTNPAKLAEVSAQRKLSNIFDGLMPAVETHNRMVAAAAEQNATLDQLKKETEAMESELSTLKFRDTRNFRGEMPSTENLEEEIADLEHYLNNGDWKERRHDRMEAVFNEEMQWRISKGTYSGEPTRSGVLKHIAGLKVQVEEVNEKISNRLNFEEIERLTELETKLPPIREGVTAAEEDATSMIAELQTSNMELKVKADAAAIIARAIIQACHIESGITSVAA